MTKGTINQVHRYVKVIYNVTDLELYSEYINKSKININNPVEKQDITQKGSL